MSPAHRRSKRCGGLLGSVAGLIGLAAVLVPLPAAPTGAERAAGDNGTGEASTNPYLGQEEAIKAGERLYRGRCVGCHRSRGGHGPNLFGTELTEERFLEVVLNGRPGTNMPPWRNTLSRDDIWKIHAFVMSRDRL